MTWKPRRKRRRHQPNAVVDFADVLPALLKRYGVDLRAEQILSQWREIAGERIAARSYPGTVHDGLLTVYVANSGWQHELAFVKARLVARVNEQAHALFRTSGPLITDIEFRLQSRTAPPPPGDPPRRPRPRARVPRPPPTASELRQIDQETAQVADPELRDVIARARRKINL